MQRYENILNPRHKVPVLASALTLLVALFLLDLFRGPRLNFPILYTFPLLATLWVRDRRLLWSAAVVLVVCAFVPLIIHKHDVVPPKTTVEGYMPWWRITNRSLAAASVLITALVMHVLMRVWFVAQRRRDEVVEEHRRLEQSHEELAVREEEISRQNEELQSQTEELERQSEELRVANDELSRREMVLEALLNLSRSLSAELSSDEMMSRICQSLETLVNGSGVATAILERRGDELHVRCHHGFGPDGPRSTRFTYAHSFAALVSERGQTGYLEDTSLRPEIQLPEPPAARGSRYGSVLAAPLRIGHRTIGSLEVYSPEKRAWSDEQIALIESLAAQTSISLETASLFEDVALQRRRLQSVLQTVPIGIMIADAHGSQVDLNPAASLILGHAVGVPMGPAEWARFAFFRDGTALPAERTPLVRALRDGIETHSEELEVMLPGTGGRRITLLVGASPIRDTHGHSDGAVAAFADITAQKNLQRELDARRREAEEVSVRKTRFLAAVSHDIRTPANAIGLLGELLQRAVGNPALASEVPDLARDLHRSAISLVNLVSDVLDLTRMDTGKVDLLESEFELGAVTTEECRQLQPLARQKGIEFHCQSTTPPIWIRADRIKVARVLGNLVGNAIKFTRHGSVKVDARRLPDGRAEIAVADTGTGIAPEHLDLIFDEFFQLRNPERDSSKGSGLGLSISKRLVEAMGGTISVTSKVGEGSTFVLTLPATSVVPPPRMSTASGSVNVPAAPSGVASGDRSGDGNGNGKPGAE